MADKRDLAMSIVKPGIYRRAFDWRLSKTDRESIPNVAAAFVGLSAEEWIDIFEDYLTLSRKRIKNRIAMAKLQLHLVEEIMLAQAAAKHYRKKSDEHKAELINPQKT